MEDKKYSINDLKKHNQTYNQMIDFLKKTIPSDHQSSLMNTFEERATEDDYRYEGLNKMYRINEFATIVTAIGAVCGISGIWGATLVTAPYTFLYYIWCKHVMKESKVNKEECIRFFKGVSELLNNVQYPFGVGTDEDISKMQSYLASFKDFEGENISEFIDRLRLGEEKDMNI